MLKNILILAAGLLMSSSAMAQDFGVIGGFHQTSGSVESDIDFSVEGKLSFKVGLAVNIELMEGSTFRTGALLNRRSLDIKLENFIAPYNGTYEFNYMYLDLPALYQYNFTDMVGVFGGIVFGLNIGDDVEQPSGADVEFDAEGIIPLLTAGVNLMFDDQMGFDFYYERGIGKVAETGTSEFKDFSSFGANFIYLF